MDTIISNHDARHKPAAFENMRSNLSIADPGTLRLGDAEISAIFPPLCRPDHILTDPGTLRLDDAEISGIFPPLCRPDRIIADPGSLRLGDAEVSAQLPCL